MDGKRMDPSSELEVDMMVANSIYFSVAIRVCHKNNANKMAKKNVLMRGPFFILLCQAASFVSLFTLTYLFYGNSYLPNLQSIAQQIQ